MDIGAELKAKMGPLPLYGWLLIMSGVGLVAYMLLKKKKSATPTTGTPGTPCTQSDGSAGTWDSTGTVCQATTVSTVNQPTTGAGTGALGTGGSLRNWRSGSSTATATMNPITTAAASTPAAAASTVPPTQAAPSQAPMAAAAGAISNLQASNVTKNGATIRWNADTGNSGGYSYAVMKASDWPKGPAVRSGVTAATSVTVTGLSPGTVYNFGVQGLPGGAGDNIHFTTLK